MYIRTAAPARLSISWSPKPSLPAASSSPSTHMSGRGTVAPRDPDSRASERHERSLPSLSPTAGWLRSAKESPGRAGQGRRKKKGRRWNPRRRRRKRAEIRACGSSAAQWEERDIARGAGEEKILGNIADLERINGGD